jgi:hypothetical protein
LSGALFEQSAAQGLVLCAQNGDLLGQVTVMLHGRSKFGAQRLD